MTHSTSDIVKKSAPRGKGLVNDMSRAAPHPPAATVAPCGPCPTVSLEALFEKSSRPLHCLRTDRGRRSIARMGRLGASWWFVVCLTCGTPSIRAPVAATAAPGGLALAAALPEAPAALEAVVDVP